MLEVENLTKTYPSRTRRGDGELPDTVAAISDFSFKADAGEFIVVRGPSGCGKTTLLMALGGMLMPSRGRVVVDGTDLYALSRSERARFRAANIGFVFQMFHLIPYLDVLENVLMGAGAGSLTDRPPPNRADALALIEKLGISHRSHHKPSELSAGEKQRAAIARAMLGAPKLMLADEPTGNLDPDNARDAVQHLRDYQSSGGTVVMVTHGDVDEERDHRIIHLGGEGGRD